MRLLVLLAALALPATLLAGCTSNNDGGGNDDSSNAPPADRNNGNGAPGNGAGVGSRPSQPRAEPVQDAGDVAGPFEKAWNLEVASVAFREAHVQFSLAGAQAGAPPTARVQLSLLDPNGALVKTESVGLGAPGDSLSWTLRAADMPAPGTYVLKATATPDANASPGPGVLPSAGLAKYTLHAEVLY